MLIFQGPKIYLIWYPFLWKLDNLYYHNQERVELHGKVSDLEMALSREKKHSRDLKEELSDKEIIDVEQVWAYFLLPYFHF